MRQVVIAFAILGFISLMAFMTLVWVIYPIRHRSDIRAASERFEIDASLIAAVIWAESRWNASSVSNKGAVGLMQLLPSTAVFIVEKKGLEVDATNLTCARTNIIIGTAYLRYLFDRFGDERTVLIAYNAGEGKVSKWLDGQDRLDTSPYPETNAYLEQVMRAKRFYNWRI